jgi:hypothetical protein
LLALGIALHQQQETRRLAAGQMAAARAMQRASEARANSPLPGQEILKDYASPGTRPEDDLHAMANAFANLLLLLKSSSPFRLGANEEFAAALMGKNAAREVFLTAPHPALNAQGQIIDRWGTPLFFHVRDMARIDIRSAGPDRAMWTQDDLHRQHEGPLLRGPDLPADGAQGRLGSSAK